MIVGALKAVFVGGVFYLTFRTMPAPAGGWRGGVGRFLQATMMAMVAGLAVYGA